MGNANEVNATLEEHFRKQEEKNEEFKSFINDLKEWMTTITMQNSLKQSLGHCKPQRDPPQTQRNYM